MYSNHDLSDKKKINEQKRVMKLVALELFEIIKFHHFSYMNVLTK
jgi:hypothetical protein